MMSQAYGSGVEGDVGFLLPEECLSGSSSVWIAILVVSKLADMSTTAVGLLFVPGVVEGNPVPATVLASAGVGPGLLVLSVLAVGAVALVTEAGVRYIRREADATDGAVLATRVIGYVPLSVVFVTAAIYNTGLIARVLLGA